MLGVSFLEDYFVASTERFYSFLSLFFVRIILPTKFFFSKFLTFEGNSVLYTSYLFVIFSEMNCLDSNYTWMVVISNFILSFPSLREEIMVNWSARLHSREAHRRSNILLQQTSVHQHRRMPTISQTETKCTSNRWEWVESWTREVTHDVGFWCLLSPTA